MKYLFIIIMFGLILPAGYCLDAAVTNVTSSKELIIRLEKMNTRSSDDSTKKMVLLLGESGDKTAIPVLQRYLPKSPRTRCSDTISGCALVALAKLGDDNAFNEIVQDTKTNNAFVYHDSFKRLGMIGNKKAVNILGQYLFIDEPPPHEVPPEKGPDGKTRQGVTKFHRPSYLAAQTLEAIFKNESPTSTNPDFYTNSDIQKWREWWQANSNNYRSSTLGDNRGVSQNPTNVLTTNRVDASQ